MTLREAVEICQGTDWLFRRHEDHMLRAVGDYDVTIVGAFSAQDILANDWEIVRPGDKSCFPK